MNESPPNASPPASSPNGASSPAASAPAATAPAAAPTGETWRNVDEVKRIIAERDAAKAEAAALKAQVTQPPPEKGKAPSELEALKAQLANVEKLQRMAAFEQKLASAAPGLSLEAAGVLKDLYEAKPPGSDELDGWLKTRLAAFGRTPGQTQGAPAERPGSPAPVNPVRTNGGPPAAGSELPIDPHTMDPASWRAMSSSQRRATWDRYVGARTVQNPFARPRPGQKG
jgi:hypothetical protein